VDVQVGDRVVRVSNPDRVYFSALGRTKLDVVNYYLSVGEGIVRALYERPCMLHRYPEGTDGEKVYQKRLPKGAPDWVQTVRVAFPSGRTADELCVTELASVAWAVQMSTVEFHPWHSRRPDTERPDELRIDLDPQPGTGYAEARVVAATVHEVLDELGAVGWPKTSGNRGMHIYVRIRPEHGFTVVRRAALAFAREVERRIPALTTTAWWKEERGEQVFLDYNQNARDRTIRCAYSLRGEPWAPVSTPLTWDEVPHADPQEFTIDTVPARFADLGDVHAGIDDTPWSIEPLLEWADRDERDRGLGDAPYPPNFPKMEGEPMRVQPSRAKRSTSGNAGQ
jgi:DNA ligase D